MKTRSQSAASTQANTLNNQRPPQKGEWVRVRLKSSDSLGNSKMHGWVSIKVSNTYRIESDDESLKTYIIRGHTENNKELQIQLIHNLDEEHLDLRGRSGWDIRDTNNTNDDKHKERLENPNHEDNLTITQRLLTTEEYKEMIDEAEEILTNPGNEYEIPTDIKIYPSCPSTVSEDEVENMTKTKRHECLGETLHDNIQVIIEICKLTMNVDIQEAQEAMVAEESLINYTNDMQDFILCSDWIESDEKSQLYLTMRQNWVTIANTYKEKKNECEKKLISIMNDTRESEDFRVQARNIHDQLTSSDNKFDDLLRRIDAKLVRNDEDLERSTYRYNNSQQNSETSRDLHVETGRSSTQSTIDTDLVVNMFHTPNIKTAPTLNNQNIGSGRGRALNSIQRNNIGQSPLLNLGRGRGRGILDQQYDPFTQQQLNTQQSVHTSMVLTTMMNNPNNLAPAQYTNTRTSPMTTDILNVKPQFTSTKTPPQRSQSQTSLLETLLLDNAQVLLNHIKRENRLLQTQVEKMKGKTPNKHSEETFKDIERKVNKLRQDEDKIQHSYAKYISDHGNSKELNTIRTILAQANKEISNIEDQIETFRTHALPDIDYIEISYQQHRDIKAPPLNVETFKGDTSLIQYIQWILNNINLPSNLINANIKETLPSLILHRLNQQHPEDGRSANQVITFLLREYGRTQEMESQLMQYHTNIGSLNVLVMSGNDQLIIPERCKDA